MSTPTESYRKVHYELRAAKQVERRMLLDAFQRMDAAGLRIRNYQYTGFGSYYFVDFILLHRFFGIQKMLSVEYSEKIRERVHFNRPYDLISIVIAPVGDVIPSLSRDLRHILWLDYDDTLREGHLRDIASACTQLSPGSIILITVDVEPPVREGAPEDWYMYFNHEAERFMNIRWTKQDFVQSLLVRRNVEIVDRAIAEGMTGRVDVQFSPLFSFVYADGHQMLTIGGMITTDSEREMLRACDFDNLYFMRTSFESEPYKISVPNVTRKERLYLDSAMPCPDNWVPPDFEMDADQVKAYREIYRFFPAFAELIL